MHGVASELRGHQLLASCIATKPQACSHLPGTRPPNQVGSWQHVARLGLLPTHGVPVPTCGMPYTCSVAPHALSLNGAACPLPDPARLATGPAVCVPVPVCIPSYPVAIHSWPQLPVWRALRASPPGRRPTSSLQAGHGQPRLLPGAPGCYRASLGSRPPPLMY